MLDSQRWIQNYPKTMQSEINPDKYQNIMEMLGSTFRQYPQKNAFSNLGRKISYQELEQLTINVASYFQNKLSLKKGDRIAIQLPNLLQYPIVLFGALKAGLTVININPLYTEVEMEKVLKDSGAETVIILENFADKLEKIVNQTSVKNIVLTQVGDCASFPKNLVINFAVKYLKKMVPKHGLTQSSIQFLDILKGTGSKFIPVHIVGQDIAFIQYTGGTTGGTKGAVLTHRNIMSNALQILEVMKTKLIGGDEKAITALPMYHIFCLTVNVIGLCHYGVENILITNPKDLPSFIKTLKEEEPTVITVVSTLAALLMSSNDFNKLNFKNLKGTIAGGMALKSSVADQWHKITGTKIYEGYGLTEASPVVSINPIIEGDRPGTIGLPLPSTDIDIRNDQNESVGFNAAGELCVRGPQVMREYWNNQKETDDILTPDGWLRTGDIASVDDDGFIKILDRKKDIIIVSGFNVYPNEIEDVAMQLPKVKEAAAIGVPDEHSGEIIKLFIVKADSSLSTSELMDYLRKNLTKYKLPKKIEFKDDLPKTNVGKVLRRELR